MFFKVTTQQYWHMDKQEQAKHLQSKAATTLKLKANKKD